MNKSAYRAAILDLDGVITQTARLHAQAWKQMFDDYLKKRSPADFVPFDQNTDYRNFIDGKPRYDGVRSFLESRGIELAEGNPEDAPGKETICGLGNRKNQLFLDLLEKKGVETYTDTVTQIRQWRQQGVKIAVISSSRNCTAILQTAGLLSLFDAKVDGVDSARLKLKGKPAPDIFLQAAQELGVEPQEAIVIEDAIAGVEAGRGGNFALVVGVDRNGNAESLREHGADMVVQDLRELKDIFAIKPSALENFQDISNRLKHQHLALFLDYDGTLTPIVNRPEDAILSQEMQSLLQQLADRTTVAVISGRDRPDVQKMVGLSNLHYAGSHGFDIISADGKVMQQEEAQASLPELDKAEGELCEQLQSIPGVRVERKRFAIAVHYREVAASEVAGIADIVERVVRQHPQLRKRGGKKIFELQPDIPWDKGRAVNWLLHQLHLDKPNVTPMYIGDDTTDEDAFKALGDRGITIRVGIPAQTTHADYFLNNPEEVQQFFQLLIPQISNTVNRGSLNHD